MPTDNIVAADASLEDIAQVVDQIVVANVAPSPDNRVIVVNRADLNYRIPEAWSFGVVDDDVLDLAVLWSPLPLAVVGATIGERRAPLGSCNDRRSAQCATVGGSFDVLQRRSAGRVDVAEGEARKVDLVAVGVQASVANELRPVGHHQLPECASIPVGWTRIDIARSNDPR